MAQGNLDDLDMAFSAVVSILMDRLNLSQLVITLDEASTVQGYVQGIHNPDTDDLILRRVM